MTHRFWLSVLCASCTFSSGAIAQLKILPIGDSITRGFSGQPSYREELVSRLEDSGCSPVTRGSQSSSNGSHEGYSGHRADHFINGNAANPGIEVTLANYNMPSDPADVVLLHIGTNDMIWQQGVNDTLAEIDEIIEFIKDEDPSPRIFLANGVPLNVLFDTTGNNRLDTGTDSDGDGFYDVSNTDADALAAGIESNYANDDDVVVVDVRTGYRPTDMDTDGIHPSEDDASDPRSDSGEHLVAVAFAAALEDDDICNPPASTDDSFPLTNILSPAVGDAISGSVTLSGRAVDTGGSGFDRVRIAIQDNAYTSSSNRWWDFDLEQFGSFDSIDAYKDQSTTNYLKWSIGESNEPNDTTDPIDLPVGEFTVFALAIDNEDNQNYFNFELWPEQTVFSVVSSAADSCNGLTANVIIANGDMPTSGDDVILGTSGVDVINALGGNDTICGLGGDDIINGGGGADWIDGGPGDDDIQGKGGDDTIFGGVGGDVINGGSGGDDIEGEEGDDSLLGQGGNDTIDGGDGIDEINGGSGSDTIFTGTGATVGSAVLVSGGGGNDTITGGPDADSIRGGPGLDTIEGAAGDDIINGGNARDTINGNAGDDVISGGNGNDEIDGGSGNDVIAGNTGSDTLLGGNGNDALDGGASVGDLCDGQGGIDTASASCETTAGIP